MIQTEIKTINGREFVHTYSDAGYKIERDGKRYSEAYDPIGTNRTYIETDEPVKKNDAEATEADYLEALAELGVTINAKNRINRSRK